MSLGWDEIEQADGFAGLRAYAEAEVMPLLSEAELRPADAEILKKRVSRALTIGFAGFVISFLIVQGLIPNTMWGETLVFFLFPVMFIAGIFGSLFLFRHSLLRVLLDAKTRFLIRGRALAVLARPLGLTYVPTPGGTPGALKWLAQQAWAPAELRDLATTFDEVGGMDDAVAAARGAGLMVEANVYVLGTKAQKEQYHKMAATQATIEDGFHGRRGGIDFDMFEWVERVDEAPDIHHLVIVLEAPLELHGVTQLRARKVGWPQEASDVRFVEIDLGPRAFDAVYRLRSTDQVEARAIFNPAVIERVIDLAHDGKFRAVAKGSRLVFDFPGVNRFNLVDVVSGEWSEETLRQTISDLVEALTLVDTLAHAFMLARKSDTGGL
ncbi:MAG: hypothetical protein CVT79_11015 [Alphaproteobacteria bacterium HGW-Alphaproteobacteria-18]|nr:MAG: hypothetical protein CVT79_11015 [Alphaproteobacteria bacterium HGW-Alphaproteobacteria-18]